MENMKSESSMMLEIKRTLPKTCFEVNEARSLAYLLRTFFLIFLLFFIADNYLFELQSNYKFILWPIYFFFQGTLFFSLFLLGHDCGHGAFGKSKQTNRLAGIIVHSFILLPYTQWKLTHRNHHRFCGDFTRDEGFGPVEEGQNVHRGISAVMALLGVAYWAYMIGISRNKTNHFSINDPLFSKSKKDAMWSLIWVLVVVGTVLIIALETSFLKVFLYYIIPLQIYTYYFMIVTFLQHNDDEITWYGQEEWSFFAGSLTTVDRNYGVLNALVCNTGFHQIHHLFPRIPHYKLKEATHHFRKHFPQYVVSRRGVPFIQYPKLLYYYVRYGAVPETHKKFRYSDVINHD